ncbi:hypothetical protein [Haloactinospora alba]|nr:hypothetical protein [Haloactinospora alba]
MRRGPGHWREDDLRRVVAELGWQWPDSETATCGKLFLETGPDTEDAWLRPVGKVERSHVNGEQYVELSVELGRDGGTDSDKADMTDSTAPRCQGDHVRVGEQELPSPDSAPSPGARSGSSGAPSESCRTQGAAPGDYDAIRVSSRILPSDFVRASI